MVLIGAVMSFFTGFNEFGGDTAYGLGYSMGAGIVYLLLASICFFPLLYLLNFSKKTKRALKLNNNKDFKSAFLNLKSYYKFMEIFTLVIIFLYLLIFIGVLASTAFFN